VVQSVEVRTFERTPASGRGPKSFEDEVLTGRIALDNTSFVRCRFRQAILVYAGGAPPQIRDCSFENVTFEFAGAAGRTLALLQALSSQKSGLRPIFKASFPKIFAN
jgi:uncharacterized protein YjbI with pentapeptide repeats